MRFVKFGAFMAPSGLLRWEISFSGGLGLIGPELWKMHNCFACKILIGGDAGAVETGGTR